MFVVIDYAVSFGNDKQERKDFCDYMHQLGYIDGVIYENELIDSIYPIGICLKPKIITIVKGTIACWNMDKNGQMKSVEEMKLILENM